MKNNSPFFYLPPLSQTNSTINIKEKINGNKNEFNYYDIELKMDDG